MSEQVGSAIPAFPDEIRYQEQRASTKSVCTRQKTMSIERSVLISALEHAARAYQQLTPQPTLFGADPDRSIMGPISAAIKSCSSFQAVAGHVLFSGGSGPVLTSPMLASHLFSKGVRFGDNIPGAVDWLLRVLATRETDGHFKAAIWGLRVCPERLCGIA
jgi:hypothetical protein